MNRDKSPQFLISRNDQMIARHDWWEAVYHRGEWLILYQKCVDKDRKQWKQRGLGCAGTELGYVDWPGKLQAIMQIAVMSYARLDLHSILSFYNLATFFYISWWFVRVAKNASCTRTSLPELISTHMIYYRKICTIIMILSTQTSSSHIILLQMIGFS